MTIMDSGWILFLWTLLWPRESIPPGLKMEAEQAARLDGAARRARAAELQKARIWKDPRDRVLAEFLAAGWLTEPGSPAQGRQAADRVCKASGNYFLHGDPRARGLCQAARALALAQAGRCRPACWEYQKAIQSFQQWNDRNLAWVALADGLAPRLRQTGCAAEAAELAGAVEELRRKWPHDWSVAAPGFIP